jgi:sec-independent protein translocase protein TatB
MFDINGWEFIALALLALFIFGPERLPKVINDGMRVLRQVRSMARNATSDLSRELGTDISVEDLNPKTFIRKHLLSEEDEAMLRRPFDDAAREFKSVANDVKAAGPNGSPSGSGSAVPEQTRRPQTYDSEAT